VRNRGLGHGVIPDEAVRAVEYLSAAIDTASDKFHAPPMLVIQEIKASPDCPGEFMERGILYDGDKEQRWERCGSHEDLLQLKRLYFLGKDGQAIPAPPFVQLDQGSFWFLQKYRRGANSLFTDYRTTVARADPFWDGHLSEFFEERFERARQTAVQCSCTGVLHNLPPESDLYAKFVGRTTDLAKLTERLNPRVQTHIVALGGLGGVGKTALARYLAQPLVESRPGELYFDYIVWASAKTTILREEVERVVPGVEDIDDVLNEIARVAESPEIIYVKPFDRKREQVLELLESQRFLVIIDNFETVKNKNSFWEFLLTIPRPSKVLVTSRETFAEGCITIQVPELGREEALEVFANECKALGVDPVTLLNKRTEKEIMERTAGVPLALKHIAILIHRGATLEQALQRLGGKTGPIADFCFRETFRTLEKPEKTVWLAMGIFQRPVAVGELVQVTALPEKEVRDILNTLKQYSIVNRSVDQEGYEIFSCLPLTLEFARKEADTWPLADELRHRFSQYRTLISRAGIKKENTAAARIFREAGVVHPRLLAQELARRALGSQREGDTPQALELIAEAEKIDPKEKSVYSGPRILDQAIS
jgi:hypothetical protein